MEGIRAKYAAMGDTLHIFYSCGPKPIMGGDVCEYIKKAVSQVRNAHYIDIQNVLEIPQDLGCDSHPNVRTTVLCVFAYTHLRTFALCRWWASRRWQTPSFPWCARPWAGIEVGCIYSHFFGNVLFWREISFGFFAPKRATLRSHSSRIFAGGSTNAVVFQRRRRGRINTTICTFVHIPLQMDLSQILLNAQSPGTSVG